MNEARRFLRYIFPGKKFFVDHHTINDPGEGGYESRLPFVLKFPIGHADFFYTDSFYSGGQYEKERFQIGPQRGILSIRGHRPCQKIRNH